MLGLAAATPVAAQPARNAHVGTSYLSIFGGGARASDSIEPTTGAGLGVELSPRVSLEGRVRWFSVPAGEKSYATDLGIRYTIAATSSARPYLSAGAGVFEAYYPGVSDGIPSFYRQRMEPETGAHAFRDMLWTVGTGADLFITGHVALRPDVSMLLATTRRDARVVPVYGIHVAYFFDSHTSYSRHR
jgi:hypothetical protein